MAEGGEFYIDCSICLGNVNCPRVLPCRHMSCESCLDQYIVSIDSQSDMLCPMCKRTISAPKAGEPRRKWAQLYPTLNLVTSEPNKDVPCREHPDKHVEMFCFDHNAPCCVKCATTQHRKCENVASVEDLALDIRKSKEMGELGYRLDYCMSRKGDIVQCRRLNIRAIETETTDAIADIRDVLKQVEHELTSSLTKEKQKKVKSHEQHIDKCLKSKQELQQIKDRLTAAAKGRSDTRLLLTNIETDSKCLSFETDLAEELDGVVNYEVSLNKSKYLETVMEKCRVTVQSKKAPLSPLRKSVADRLHAMDTSRHTAEAPQCRIDAPRQVRLGKIRLYIHRNIMYNVLSACVVFR
jgi:hypothetical protein